jgi:hypothetical protein
MIKPCATIYMASKTTKDIIKKKKDNKTIRKIRKK